MIPEAAVEAAAKCLPGYDPDWGGDEMDRAENEALRSRARQILEAATPHIVADLRAYLDREIRSAEHADACLDYASGWAGGLRAVDKHVAGTP